MIIVFDTNIAIFTVIRVLARPNFALAAPDLALAFLLSLFFLTYDSTPLDGSTRSCSTLYIRLFLTSRAILLNLLICRLQSQHLLLKQSLNKHLWNPRVPEDAPKEHTQVDPNKTQAEVLVVDVGISGRHAHHDVEVAHYHTGHEEKDEGEGPGWAQGQNWRSAFIIA
jgi:hypothetical protein